jgi:hypothetical protein
MLIIRYGKNDHFEIHKKNGTSITNVPILEFGFGIQSFDVSLLLGVLSIVH